MPQNNNVMTFQEAKSKLMETLLDHLGKEHAIGMDALHEQVFGEKTGNKINGTRRLRKLVTALRKQGKAIGSVSTSDGGGYYIPRAGSELEEYLKTMLHRPAIRKLAMEAKIRKTSLPKLIGQMLLNMED